MATKGKTPDNIQTEYDDLPYPSYPYHDTHPNKLCSMGILFGMQPAAVDQCKVLELGCGSGSNIIGMAAGLPDSSFTGIDLSKNEIKLALQKKQALKLKNLDLQQKNILDIDKTFGKFDYIICHGVFSWVSEDIRNKILSICRDNLTDNGIAYISYNTYPAWHTHEMVRDMMLFHIRDIKDKHKSIVAARELLNSITKIARPNSPFQTFLRFEAERMMKFSDPYFYHDQLSQINQPFEFYKFADLLTAHKLQYLCETDLPSTLPRNFSKKTMELVEKYGNDIINVEQYLDYVMNRAFRKTLICNQNTKLNRTLDPVKVKDFYYTSSFKPEMQHEQLSKNEMAFKSDINSRLVAKDPLSSTIWLYLKEHYPQPLSLEQIKSDLLKQLKQQGNETVSENQMAEHIMGNLLLGYSIGGVDFYTQPAPLTTAISNKPTTTALARYEATAQNWVTNQLHCVVHIDSIHQYVIPLLDGNHDHNALIYKLLDLVKKGKLTVRAHKKRLSDEEIISILQTQLHTILKNLARQALLIK